MARARRVGLVFQQEMHVLAVDLEPDDHEIESARPIDFAHAEDVAIEAPAALDIGNQHRA